MRKKIAYFTLFMFFAFLVQANPKDSLRSEIRDGHKFIVHRVLKGDNLTNIANKYAVSESQILSSNPIVSDNVYPGQILRIPMNEEKYGNVAIAPTVAATPTNLPLAKTLPAPASIRYADLGASARNNAAPAAKTSTPPAASTSNSTPPTAPTSNSTPPTASTSNSTPPTAPTSNSTPPTAPVNNQQTPNANSGKTYNTYVVASPQTVTHLAASFGVEPQDIIDLNNLKNYNLKEGQKVKIPIAPQALAKNNEPETKPVVKPAEPAAAQVVAKAETKTIQLRTVNRAPQPVAKVEPKQEPIPEPVVAKVEPKQEPIPEPIVAKVEPKPVPVPDPVVARVEPVPVPVVARVEPVPVPVVARVEPKPAPKPVPDPVVARVEPVPVPVVARVEPKPAPKPKPVPVVAKVEPKPAPKSETPPPAMAAAPKAQDKKIPAIKQEVDLANQTKMDDDSMMMVVLMKQRRKEELTSLDSAYLHPRGVAYKVFDYKETNYNYDLYSTLLSNENAIDVKSTNQRKGSGTKNTTHVVGKNETLQMVARKYKISATDIINWNGLLSYRIREGQELTINAARAEVSPYERTISKASTVPEKLLTEKSMVGLASYDTKKVGQRGVYVNGIDKGKFVHIINKDNYREDFARVLGPLPKGTPSNIMLILDSFTGKELMIGKSIANIELYYGVVDEGTALNK